MHNNTPIVPYISICSEYEGIGIGLHRCIPNLRCIAYCEREAFAVANLVAKMENGLLDAAPVFTDVTTFPWEQYAPYMAGGILSFGWPCQPVSCAGKRKATEDERWLFDIIADGIAIMRPGILFAENVEGLLSAKMPNGSLVFSHCIERLESLHYKVAAGIFSASEVGAPHQRKRVFILAYDKSLGIQGCGAGWLQEPRPHAGQALPVRGGDAGGRELADTCHGSNPEDGYAEAHRLPSKHWQEVCSGFAGGANATAWPSRPGEPQHAWEPPRVVGNAPQLFSDGSDNNSRISERSKEISKFGNAGWNELGNADHGRLTSGLNAGSGTEADRGGQGDIEQAESGQTESALGGDADGPAGGLGYAELQVSCDNRTDELRLLGNGVVPATATRAFLTLIQELCPNTSTSQSD